MASRTKLSIKSRSSGLLTERYLPFKVSVLVAHPSTESIVFLTIDGRVFRWSSKPTDSTNEETLCIVSFTKEVRMPIKGLVVQKDRIAAVDGSLAVWLETTPHSHTMALMISRDWSSWNSMHKVVCLDPWRSLALSEDSCAAVDPSGKLWTCSKGPEQMKCIQDPRPMTAVGVSSDSGAICLCDDDNVLCKLVTDKVHCGKLESLGLVLPGAHEVQCKIDHIAHADYLITTTSLEAARLFLLRNSTLIELETTGILGIKYFASLDGVHALTHNEFAEFIPWQSALGGCLANSVTRSGRNKDKVISGLTKNSIVFIPALTRENQQATQDDWQSVMDRIKSVQKETLQLREMIAGYKAPRLVFDEMPKPGRIVHDLIGKEFRAMGTRRLEREQVEALREELAALKEALTAEHARQDNERSKQKKIVVLIESQEELAGELILESLAAHNDAF